MRRAGRICALALIGDKQVYINGQQKWVFQLRTTQAGGSGAVSVTATNAGGYTATATIYVTSPSCAGGHSTSAYTLYPNPANEHTALVPAQPTGAAEQPGATIVRVYDNTGRLRAEQAGGNDLRTVNLPPGTYTFHVLRDGQIVERKQLRIER